MKKEKLTGVVSKLMKLFPKRFMLNLAIIILIVSALVQISFSYLMRSLLDVTLASDLNQFLIILYLLVGAIVLNLILTYLSQRILGNYTEGGIKRLRFLLAKKMSNVKLEYLTQSHSGDYVSRATNDMNNVRNFTFSTLPRLIILPLMAISALGLLIYYSWQLTLIIIVTIPVLFILLSIFNKPIGIISKKRQKELAKVNAITTDFIRGVEVAKAYNIEENLENKSDEAINESVFYGKKLEKRNSAVISISNVFGLAPFFVVFIVGGYFVSKPELGVTIGTLLGFIYLLNFIVNPISELPGILAQSLIDKASMVRIFEVLNLQEERKDGESFEDLRFKPFIEFKNVTFSYPEQEGLVLDNVSFQINSNELIALVGPSGGGKSTVIKLILGYYDNYEGEIMIGGHELKSWNLTSLRKLISYVSQDTFLFPESIYENIQYAKSTSTTDEIEEFAKKANAHQFISEFSNQYQTKVGELGGTLSGGQKQRISIARAMLKDSPIFLLDEATSALDNESEALIQDALEKSFKDKTSIVIAHRLSTIKNVDRILVLKEGKIVESGTHDELIKLNGNYSQLYHKQFENNEPVEELI